MGTSTSNPGPRGRDSLLPPWATPLDPDIDDADLGATPADGIGPDQDVPAGDAPAEDGRDTAPEPAEDQPQTWISPRRLLGKLAASSPRGAAGRQEAGRALGRAVRAMGGARAAASASPSGRRTARALGGFLSAVAAQGLAAAAQAFGLADYVGRGAEVFLARLADTLAPDGAENEDAVARAALLATLEQLENSLDLATEGVEALERMSPDIMADTMVRFYANYLYERLMNALQDHIARRALSNERVGEIARDCRRYVRDAVRADLPVRAPVLRNGTRLAATRWQDAEGRQLVDRIFVEAFAVMEVELG